MLTINMNQLSLYTLNKVRIAILLPQHRKLEVQRVEVADKFVDEYLAPFHVEKAKVLAAFLQAVVREYLGLYGFDLAQVGGVVTLFGLGELGLQVIYGVL